MRIARGVTALFLSLAAVLAAAAWTPPAKPDPRVIHNEARKDRMEQRYEDALAKHLWLYHQGAKVEPRWAPARVTFAMGDWAHLAAKFPPAMEALKRERDSAEANVKAGKDPVRSFEDFAAINRELDEPGPTTALFLWVEARDEALAKSIARYAQHALMQSGDFKTAARYVDANAAMAQVVRMRSGMVGNMPKDADEEFRKSARATYAREAARIVAMVAANGRTVHAKRLYEQALDADPSPEVREVLDAALKGESPKEALTREERAQLLQALP
jgi:hypothetical protein